MSARIVGPGAARLRAALRGVAVDDGAATVVYVALEAPDLDGLEDALTAWVDAARDAAAFGGDIVTVVADDLLDSDDVAGCAYGHGLVAATRAFAMEREREGAVANVVAVDPSQLDRASSAVAWVLRDRAVSGEVLRAGAPTHGKQRL